MVRGEQKCKLGQRHFGNDDRRCPRRSGTPNDAFVLDPAALTLLADQVKKRKRRGDSVSAIPGYPAYEVCQPVRGPPRPADFKVAHYPFFAALIFAHRARCAAAILFLPAADILRVGRAVLFRADLFPVVGVPPNNRST